MNASMVITLLIVEDCAEDRLTYRRFLQQDSLYTYQITELETTTEARIWCKQTTPDLILLDLMLPDSPGLALLEQLRQDVSLAQSAIIILTGQADVDTVIRSLKSGAQDYLIKNSLTPGHFQQAVHSALERLYLARNLEQRQAQQTLMTTIALRIQQSLQLDEVLDTTVREVRQLLNADRVLIYQFQPDWNGTIVAEAVLPGWTISLGTDVEDTCFQQGAGADYRRGKTRAIDDIYQADLTDCHVQLLERFEVKANLVVPILVRDQLWGLLVAHQCQSPRHWQALDLEMLDQLAVQIAIGIQQAHAYNQAQQTLIDLNQRTMELEITNQNLQIALEEIQVSEEELQIQNEDLMIANQTAEVERQRYEDLFNFAPDGYLVTNIHGLIQEANRAAKDLLAMEQSHLVGTPLVLYVPTQNRDSFIQNLHQVQASLQKQVYELSLQSQQGHLFPAEITATAIQNPQGRVVGIRWLIQDITERKRAETEHRRTERLQLEFDLLETILEVTLAGYWDWNIPEHQEYLSPTFKQMLGYEDHELPNIPETWQGLIFPEDLPGVMACFDRHVQSQGQLPFYNEVRYHHKNGSIVWVICAGQVIEWDEHHQPLRMVGCHIDITDLKHTETSLKASEARYRAIIEDQTELIARFLPDTTIVFVNEAYCRYFGVKQEEIIGRSYAPVVFEADQDKVAELVQTMTFENPTVTIENRVVVNGEIRWTQWINRMLFNEQGEFIEFQAVGRDITELKQIEADLRQANERLMHATRLKDEFLASMSHELRTPLNAILGMTEGLQDKIFGPINDRQQQVLNIIEHSGNHLLELINDILDLSKIESGKLELQISTISIKDLCEESLIVVRQAALKKEIQLSCHIPEDIGSIQADDRRLRQVLINLLNNAVKFTPAGGSVRLEVTRVPPAITTAMGEPEQAYLTQASIIFSVTDTGIGIAPENLYKLFQPFVQIDSKLNRQHSGTGLGLALSRRIVDLHGGEITVQSQLGQGSCFTFQIPDQPPSPSPNIRPPRQPSDLSPASETDPEGLRSTLILLAEDNEANVQTVSAYLQSYGYRLILARNGEDAIAQAKAHQPNLILMDIQMPNMDGITAIQHLRKEQDLIQVPIIALTALAMPGDRERCLEAGANEYLTKPVSLRQLVALIQDLLASW
ncbi:PAS domain S-box protein [Leptolyngbya sp. 'hensonii']|uniref:PAS domain S-box protein n=1 Tax=Leptolyngbya sp. 'hensonii' TaxID=1922337 RepID=UPI000ACE34F9|nr:PAS domain S-box protein [Leptolyngbya sp. 'hensonii']